MEQIDLAELRQWIREAGQMARHYFNRVAGRRKADHSWVTEADIAIEHMLVERIAASYPTHGIIGEEQTRRSVDHEYVWAIDPLDGTASFITGLPTWGISLGLLRNRTPYLGVCYLPLLDDCYWNEPDGGAFLNGHTIHVIEPRAWESEDWIAVPSNTHRRFSINFPAKSRSLGSAVVSICYVARGSAVGALLNRLSIWDIAGSLAILQAAGGCAIGLSGHPLDTTGMLNGNSLAEPVVVGEATHVTTLRSGIQVRS